MKTITKVSLQPWLREENNRNRVVNLRGLLLVLISIFSLNLVFSQESVSRSERIEKLSSSSEISVSGNSKVSPEFKELEIKINALLKEARSQLQDVSNRKWLEENLQNSLRMKSAQVCPNVQLLDLMFGNEPFTASSNMDKQELLYAIDFLNVSLNGMLTK